MALIDFLYFGLLILLLLGIFAVVWLIGGYILYRVVDRKLRACPNCKRGASGTIIETEIEPLGTQIDRTGKEAMRVKSEKVTDHYQCKHCNHTWMRTFERKERTPVNTQNR